MSGRTLKAFGCKDFSDTISATIVLIMPTFPLQAPDPALAAIAIGKLVERPNMMLVAIVENKARITMGLRPK
jgi:hypothetical protein